MSEAPVPNSTFNSCENCPKGEEIKMLGQRIDTILDQVGELRQGEAAVKTRSERLEQATPFAIGVEGIITALGNNQTKATLALNAAMRILSPLFGEIATLPNCSGPSSSDKPECPQYQALIESFDPSPIT